MAEQRYRKPQVAGSTPVTSSTKSVQKMHGFFSFFCSFSLDKPSLQYYNEDVKTIPERSFTMDKISRIRKANLSWNIMPTHYFEGPYIGNGNMGAVIWQNEDGSLYFESSRTDYFDHRNDTLPILFRTCRLKAGGFSLSMDGETISGKMEMDLYDAVVLGTLETQKSSAKVRIFNCDDRDVFVVELEKLSGKCDFELSYIPYPCESPRNDHMPREGYVGYPIGYHESEDGINYFVQDLPEGEEYENVGKGEAQYVAAWTREDDGNFVRFYVTLRYTYPGKGAKEIAKNELVLAVNDGVDKLFAPHLDFWHDFWKDCLDISVPDERMQNYYYLQTYRFASATRKTGPVLDLLGPWYCPTTWPGIWWNMNEQITYSHISFANHPEYVNPVIDMLYDGRKSLAINADLGREDVYCLGRASGSDLIETANEQSEYGNLAYMLYYLYESNRTVMDDKVLGEKLLPLMIGAFKFLLTKTFTGDDGKLHFVSSASPEFTNGVEDASYTISATKWLARTILEVHERLGTSGEICDTCRDFLANVMDYLVDENDGFMIGKDMPLNCFHTHWSHFFMVYPYHEYDFESEELHDAIHLTFQKWIQRQEEKFFAGFCTAGAMSLYALKGEGDNVLRRFDYYYNNKDFYYNGMFTDTIHKGRFAPVFETPIGIVRGLEEMLLYHKRGAIHLFHAIPSTWDKSEFYGMRTKGAFLVSAKYENGKVTYAEIESLAGEKCLVNYENLSHLNCSNELVINGKYAEISLEKGQKAIFSSKA